MTNPVDFHNLAAQCRHGLPSTWQWRQIASLDGGFFQLTGASPVGTYQRGPRKGQPKFPATPNYRQVIITAVDVAEARSRWERETGQCSWCGGTGQEVARVSARTGATYRTCRACGGSGKAKD